jgi:hypothetical protein
LVVQATREFEPSLADFSLSPASINTSSGSRTITVTAHITDDMAGNAGAGYSSSPSQVRFVSPSANQSVWAMLDGYHLVSGTATDGVYQYTMTVPQFSECGSWHVDYLMLVDQVGNTESVSESQSDAAGFPASFTNC